MDPYVDGLDGVAAVAQAVPQGLVGLGEGWHDDDPAGCVTELSTGA
jgi:hypothetical protein